MPVPLRPKPTQTVLAPTCQNAMESYLPTCINPCKSGDGSCLKKIDLPTQGGGVEVGILGGQQIKSQNSGKCHELSRKSIIFFFLHIPPRGVPGRGGWGSTFKKSGKFHELSRKSIKKSPPPPTNRGRSGNFRGSKNQKTGKCHELSRKSIKFVFLPIPPRGFRAGGFGGQNFKSPVNFMNCRENR